jgi:5-methylcytosine-specific restriction endonuclease McrA
MPNKKYLFIEDEVARNIISQELKDLVFARDKGKCAVCHGNEELDYDHIVPLMKGGSNTSRNIQLVCKQCRVNKD